LAKSKKSPKKKIIDSVREDRPGVFSRIQQKRVSRLERRLTSLSALPD